MPAWMRDLWNRAWRIQPKTEFGLEIGVNLGYGFAADAAKIAQIAAVGVKWVRLPLAWDWIETSKGVYDWTPFLAAVDAFNGRHISVLLVTNNVMNPPYYADELVSAGPHAPSTPGEIADYATFHGLAAKALGNRSVMYEIGNEVNWNYTGPLRGVAYTAVVQSTAAQIRGNYSGRGRPCTIIGPGVTPDHSDFIGDCATAGLFGYLDGCSVHPYGYGQPNWRPLSQLPNDYDGIRAMLASYPNMPIYSSEWGYSTVGDTAMDSYTPSGQAQALLNMFAAERDAGVRLSIWYEFSDDGRKAAGDHEGGFGLVDQHFVPKPAYYAAQKFLGGYSPLPPNPRTQVAPQVDQA